METHGQKMARQFRAYNDETKTFFLTKLDPSAKGVAVTHEVMNPLLKGPRWTVTCPAGTDVVDVVAAFAAEHWPPEVYRLWWEKNGRELVRKGYLHE